MPAASVVSEPTAGWLLERDGQESLVLPDGAELPGWDALLKFKLRRSFTIPADIQRQLLLPGFADLRIIARVGTARGGRSWVEYSSVVAHSVTILIEPNSAHLSRDITIEVAILAQDHLQECDPIAPVVPGARVWSDDWTAKLEGGRLRLPMEETSFRHSTQCVMFPEALFHVHVSDDPDLDVEEGICVYLNADFPKFVKAIENNDPVASAALWEGCVRRIISSGIVEEFHLEGSRPGSLGAHVAAWLHGIFPACSRDDVRRMRDESPSSFEASIQSWCRAHAQAYGGSVP